MIPVLLTCCVVMVSLPVAALCDRGPVSGPVGYVGRRRAV